MAAHLRVVVLDTDPVAPAGFAQPARCRGSSRSSCAPQLDAVMVLGRMCHESPMYLPRPSGQPEIAGHGLPLPRPQVAGKGHPEDDSGPLSLGLAVAPVKGRIPTEALEILGADCAVGIAAAVDVQAWANLQDYWNHGTAVEAGRLGDWTVVVDFNGLRGADRELLSRLSDRGRSCRHLLQRQRAVIVPVRQSRTDRQRVRPASWCSRPPLMAAITASVVVNHSAVDSDRS